MTDKLQFPDGFLGGRQLLTSVRELIMKTAVAGLMWMWCRLGLIVTPLLRQKKMFDLKAIFIQLRMALICIIAKEDIALFGEMGFKPIVCPLPGL